MGLRGAARALFTGAIGAILFLVAPAGAGAAVNFSPQTEDPVAATPNAVALGELTGDDRPDIAVGGAAGGAWLLPALADGGFDSPGETLNGQAGREAPAIGDFDHDGRADLALINAAGGTVSIYLAADGFAPGPAYDVGRDPISIASADFDRDGDLDLVVVNRGSGTLSVLRGNGHGSFAPKQDLVIGGEPHGIAIADFDSDGVPDLAVTDAPTYDVGVPGFVVVLIGDGRGGFGAGAAYRTRATPLSVASGDLDGDGDQDIAAANYYTGVLTLLMGDGQGGFTAGGSPAAGDSPNSIAIADLDSDRRADVVLRDTGYIRVLPGEEGGLGAPRDFPTGASSAATNRSPRTLALADLNRDGRPDVITANDTADSVSVLLNTSPLEPGIGGAASTDDGPQQLIGGASASSSGQLHTLKLLRARSVRDLVKSGERALVTCDIDCHVVMLVKVSAATARRLGIPGRVIARGDLDLGAGETGIVKAVLGIPVRAALLAGGLKKVQISLHA